MFGYCALDQFFDLWANMVEVVRSFIGVFAGQSYLECALGINQFHCLCGSHKRHRELCHRLAFWTFPLS